jgi:hypothetical protein
LKSPGSISLPDSRFSGSVHHRSFAARQPVPRAHFFRSKSRSLNLICLAFVNLAPTFAHKCLVCRADAVTR